MFPQRDALWVEHDPGKPVFLGTIVTYQPTSFFYEAFKLEFRWAPHSGEDDIDIEARIFEDIFVDTRPEEARQDTPEYARRNLLRQFWTQELVYALKRIGYYRVAPSTIEHYAEHIATGLLPTGGLPAGLKLYVEKLSPQDTMRCWSNVYEQYCHRFAYPPPRRKPPT